MQLERYQKEMAEAGMKMQGKRDAPSPVLCISWLA